MNCGITSSGLIEGHVIGILQGGRADNIFEEIMPPKFPNLVKSINLEMQEDQQTLNIRNLNKIVSRHTIIKLVKASNKEKTLKVARGKKTH